VIERYLVVAGRIRQEVANLERIVTRAERAVTAVRQRPDDQDLYLVWPPSTCMICTLVWNVSFTISRPP